MVITSNSTHGIHAVTGGSWKVSIHTKTRSAHSSGLALNNRRLHQPSAGQGRRPITNFKEGRGRLPIRAPQGTCWIQGFQLTCRGRLTRRPRSVLRGTGRARQDITPPMNLHHDTIHLPGVHGGGPRAEAASFSQRIATEHGQRALPQNWARHVLNQKVIYLPICLFHPPLAQESVRLCSLENITRELTKRAQCSTHVLPTTWTRHPLGST